MADMTIITGERLAGNENFDSWGWMTIDNVRISGSPTVLRQDFMAWQAELSKTYDSNSMAALPRFATTKAMFNTLAAMPDTEQRMAWMARVLAWRGGTYVNSASDVAMHCAIRFAVPVGVYDRAAVRGRLVCDMVSGIAYT
ncbi:MAG: hypothetical protein N3A57_05065, partial [Negativicutes bacterium]|nr:hypothetical protein [Negativicutes bacterium]